MIKHVSFDVWGTLITANPEYAMQRTALLGDAFGLELMFVKTTYTKTKQYIDNLAETEGVALTTRQCFDMLYTNLGVTASLYQMQNIEHDLHRLFLHFAPTILDETKHQIASLKARGLTVSIASNSNFIPGDVMYPFLQREFKNAFHFGVFSDRMHAAKPSGVFFDEVIFEANLMRCDEDMISFNEILHVGDNYTCDGTGPAECGMPYVILNDPADLQLAIRHLAFLFRKEH